MNNIPSIDEQKERGLKFLESANPLMAEFADDTEALCAYKEHLRTGIYIGPPHPLNMIRGALHRMPETPERVIGKSAIGTVIEGTTIKHFQCLRDKENFMDGLECSNVEYTLLDCAVADFLEQYLIKSNDSNG